MHGKSLSKNLVNLIYYLLPPPPEVEVEVLFPDLLEEEDRNLDPEDLEEDDRDDEDLDPPRLLASVKVKNKIQTITRMDNVTFFVRTF